MTDHLFALLDDIAQASKDRHGDSSHPNGTPVRFGDHQLLDNEPQYYASEQHAQNLRHNDEAPDRGRDGSRFADEDKHGQPQGSKHFQNQATHVGPGLGRLARLSNTSQHHNASMQPSQQRPSRMKDEYMSNGTDQARPYYTNFSQYSSRGHVQERMSSPTVSGLPSSPALKASQRRHDHRVGQLHIQHCLEDAADTLEASADPNGQTTLQDEVLKPITWPHAARLVQGIELLSTHELPDRFRSIFGFPVFNAVQSKCFNTIYRTNDNFVLSSPTGSGKTVAFELAICRLINGFSGCDFKIVYQAPTKSLCSERQRDWSHKFRPFGLECAELTGDTDLSQMKNVQNASIIVTTPEKWDSMTRKWKDHIKLMQMIKLFLIDEVHMLKEERGAVLEVVVSRMKSTGSDVRFVALSASIPNSNDIASWLGKNPMAPQLPATREVFGEEFRPVKLQKHVVGYNTSSNDFAFEKSLEAKLPDVIAKYSHRKPIMVFCATRKSVETTAQMLATWWSTNPPKARYWESSRQYVAVEDRLLKGCVSAAVGFHHAGLGYEDRLAVERGFLNGDINVICCTSTLAVGVNLPCHFVIIKNTCTYTNEGLKEYSDLEVMQMLGRAGRPQFDSTAVAVIMTRQEKVKKYEKMVSGQEILESCLHRNLIDHLNAEIVLGTVTSISSAKKWLSGTFLYVRLREHPEHYRIDEDDGKSRLEERLERIASRDINLLRESQFARSNDSDTKLFPTDFGEAMARYCVHFETAKRFLELPPRAKMSEILSVLAQAKEYKENRFRANEKSCYKEMNKSPSIKFPIPVNLDLPAHKVSLIIQSQLGGVEFPTDEKTTSARFQFSTDINLVFQHISRLIRCIVDLSLYREDAVALRHSLALCRSLGARCWDESPLQLRQLEKIGIVGVRKLVNAGIKSIEELESTEPHRIEAILKRAPPFGLQIVDSAKAFPKPRVSVEMVGFPVGVPLVAFVINVKAEIGFINEKLPVIFQKRAVYVVFLAETSDGHKVEFRRISAKKLNQGTDIKFSVTLTDPTQVIACHVSCDEFAGTLRTATLAPKLPKGINWPRSKPTNSPPLSIRPAPNSARRRSEMPSFDQGKSRPKDDEFGDDELDDQDLLAAINDDSDNGFKDIDDYGKDIGVATAKATKQTTRAVPVNQTHHDWEPTKMANGRWSCNHRCKDRSGCRHMCCREGLDKPPKPPKNAAGDKNDTPRSTQQSKTLPKGQSTLKTTLSLNKSVKPRHMASSGESDVAQVDLTEEPKKAVAHVPGEMRRLEKLHSKTMAGRAVTTPTFLRQNITTSQQTRPRPHLSSMPEHNDHGDNTSDYGGSWPDSDLPDLDMLTKNAKHSTQQHSTPIPPQDADEFEPIGELDNYGDSDSLMNEAMVGLADSQDLASQTNLASSHASRIAEPYENDIMTALECISQDTSAIIMPKQSRKSATQTPGSPESSMPASPSPAHRRPQVGPFIDTSSDLFVTPGSTLHHQGPPLDDDGFGGPCRKKRKTASVAEQESALFQNPSPLIDQTDVDMGGDNEEEDAKAKREEIDAWFMQEFGQYVEFT
ncbi:hypothetical protein FKW77_006241 [Venturia effusa]|uniref:DNA 3'-5' helicase n=1 Tax=Venturia effusa TaxID=50376 RepID=A0A517LHB8_9PEZI|nr:hypothetical protein FKW77_006241 [Venturia effusa]